MATALAATPLVWSHPLLLALPLGMLAALHKDRGWDAGAIGFSLLGLSIPNFWLGPMLILVLDGVTDPHNLGACLRTADAAGVNTVVLPRHGAAGLSPTVSKVAAGAAEQVPFAQVGNLSRVLGWLKDYGVRCVGTSDKAARTLYDTDLRGSIALVMGQEHSGLGKALAGRCDRQAHSRISTA